MAKWIFQLCSLDMKRMTQFPACYTVLCFFSFSPTSTTAFCLEEVWSNTQAAPNAFLSASDEMAAVQPYFTKFKGQKSFGGSPKKKPRSSSVCGAVMWVESQKVWGEKVSCKHHLTPTKMQLWFKPTTPPPSKTTRFSGHKHCYDICFHISQPLQYLCVALLYKCCKHICFYSSLDFRKPFVCLSMHEHSAQANQTV